MNVEIEISREFDEFFPVTVKILSYHKGKKDPIHGDYTDDVSECEAENVGYDEKGNEYKLHMSEVIQAQETFLESL